MQVRYMDRFVVTELQPPTASGWGRFSISRADLLSHIGIIKERRMRKTTVEAPEGVEEEEDDDELLSNFVVIFFPNLD